MSTKYGLKLKETGDLLYVGQIRGSEPGKNYIGLGPEQYWNGDSGAIPEALRAYDQRITRIARGQQRHGRKPRDSARYRKAVAALRGWIRTEVGRVLNALVAAKRPATIVLERLNFQNPTLSRRLNRIIQNCGRSVIRAKLADFNDRFGITSSEVNPAYTSEAGLRSWCPWSSWTC